MKPGEWTTRPFVQLNSTHTESTCCRFQLLRHPWPRGLPILYSWLRHEYRGAFAAMQLGYSGRPATVVVRHASGRACAARTHCQIGAKRRHASVRRGLWCPKIARKVGKGQTSMRELLQARRSLLFLFNLAAFKKAILQKFAVKRQILHRVSESGFHSRLPRCYCATVRPLHPKVELPAVHLVLRAFDSYDATVTGDKSDSKSRASMRLHSACC